MSGSGLYERFMALHTREGGLVMPNAWDAISALILADAGFEAVGTSSAALAATLGRPDGRHAVTREEHLAHARLLGQVTPRSLRTSTPWSGSSPPSHRPR